MRHEIVLGKTEKGREEIAQRKFHLGGRLRTWLVLVDGKHSKQDLLDKFGGMGLCEDDIVELLNNEFIETIGGKSEVPALLPDTETAQSTTMERADPDQAIELTERIEKLVHPDRARQDAGQFHAVYNFYTQTIKNTLGLRGFMLQLKVERASTLDDLRDLRGSYLDAVRNAKGDEMARSLRTRLNQLLAA